VTTQPICGCAAERDQLSSQTFSMHQPLKMLLAARVTPLT
jgi:hypothetical protein